MVFTKTNVMKKTFVGVEAFFSEAGEMAPKKIFWKDGKVYEISKIISVKNRPSLKVGGVGQRFEIVINRQTTFLFYEDGLWFVEEL